MAEITNELLKSAIADAEAVRETAIANAKVVLEEAITPQIRDMIARRLRAEADAPAGEEQVAEEAEVEVQTEAEEVEEGHNPHVGTDADDFSKVEEGAAPEVPHEDGEYESGGPQASSDVGTGDNREPSKGANDSSGVGTPRPENDPDADHLAEGEEVELDEWDEGDFDLAEVIRELEEDIAALSAGEVVAEEEHDEEEAEEEPEMEEGWASEGEDAVAPEAEAEEEDDDELDLEEILRELEASDDEEEADDMADDHEKKAMAAELARLKGEMAQYKEAVNILRGRLQEVNLLNAKLLFTNKMFRKDSLTNEQKVRIVESFDRATTVREVKLVYTALVENLSTATKVFNQASRKRVVAEGVASKATPSTAPKSEKAEGEVIVENTVAKRLQQLAGIL